MTILAGYPDTLTGDAPASAHYLCDHERYPSCLASPHVVEWAAECFVTQIKEAPASAPVYATPLGCGVRATGHVRRAPD